MSGTAWTQSAITALTELWARGATASQIGKRMGITRNAVIGKAHRLKLRPRRYVHDAWSEQDMAALTEMWATKATAKDAAKLLRRTKDACYRKARHMGLSRSAP